MLLLCSFFRLKELFQVKNGLTTSLLFFWKMLKIWVAQMMLTREKKEDGLTAKKIFPKSDTIKQSYKDTEQQALKGVHENETLISHHSSCKSSWYTLIRDAEVH